LCEDVILNRKADWNRKADHFRRDVKSKGKVEVKDEAWRNTPVEES
jgi:5-methyltetrahydrofolate--homocysteine methyltransferase